MPDELELLDALDEALLEELELLSPEELALDEALLEELELLLFAPEEPELELLEALLLELLLVDEELEELLELEELELLDEFALELVLEEELVELLLDGVSEPPPPPPLPQANNVKNKNSVKTRKSNFINKLPIPCKKIKTKIKKSYKRTTAYFEYRHGFSRIF